MLKESCAKCVAIMLHYASTKKIILSLNTCFVEVRATLQCNSLLLCLDYYEMSFLEMKKQLALMKQQRVELAKHSCMLKPNIEALFPVEITR